MAWTHFSLFYMRRHLRCCKWKQYTHYSLNTESTIYYRSKSCCSFHNWIEAINSFYSLNDWKDSTIYNWSEGCHCTFNYWCRRNTRSYPYSYSYPCPLIWIMSHSWIHEMPYKRNLFNV